MQTDKSPPSVTNRSTGPRSPEGKTQSSRNAFKHGLYIPIAQDPDLEQEVVALAQRIACDKRELMPIALRIAEAELDLIRVRRIQSELINKTLRNQHYIPRPTLKFVNMLGRVLNRRIRKSDEPLLKDMIDQKNASTPERHARVLVGLARQLALLERYERRALSRRKFAIREFDGR